MSLRSRVFRRPLSLLMWTPKFTYSVLVSPWSQQDDEEIDEEKRTVKVWASSRVTNQGQELPSHISSKPKSHSVIPSSNHSTELSMMLRLFHIFAAQHASHMPQGRRWNTASVTEKSLLNLYRISSRPAMCGWWVPYGRTAQLQEVSIMAFQLNGLLLSHP